MLVCSIFCLVPCSVSTMLDCTFLLNHLIKMYCKCGDDVVARQLFDKISEMWNNIVSKYVKLGMVGAARRLFDQMPVRDVVWWNSMIVGYVKSWEFGEYVRVFKESRRSSIGFNELAFMGFWLFVLKVRTLGKKVHCGVLIYGFFCRIW